ncbi:hypothetical protein TheetDRAFT_0737 [Thermoanaerobacter ethanolicus JW 200]|nr:hypothetical protein TheetDRAFT_0737 [Thermoanaerobacter ethanolicus JW 200]
MNMSDIHIVLKYNDIELIQLKNMRMLLKKKVKLYGV